MIRFIYIINNTEKAR